MERDDVIQAAHALAAAISRRDTAAVRELVTPDFLLRTPGKGAVNVEAFLAGIQQIPGEIISVRLEHLELDLTPAGVLVTGIQRAQVRIEGNLVEDVRPFVDWFVQSDAGRWRVKLAIDLPATG